MSLDGSEAGSGVEEAVVLVAIVTEGEAGVDDRQGVEHDGVAAGHGDASPSRYGSLMRRWRRQEAQGGGRRLLARPPSGTSTSDAGVEDGRWPASSFFQQAGAAGNQSVAAGPAEPSGIGALWDGGWDHGIQGRRNLLGGGVLGEGRHKDPPGAKTAGLWSTTVPEQERGKDDKRLRGACLARLESAARLGFDELKRRHVSDFEELFDRVEFSVGPGVRQQDGMGREEDGIGHGEAGEASCSAGLPIRRRVARSGQTCRHDGSEPGRTGAVSRVEDDGLIELTYHFGR